MDKFSKEEIISKIADLSKQHEDKKLEIKNLSLLMDKKIGELTTMESDYVALVVELNKLVKYDVVR